MSESNRSPWSTVLPNSKPLTPEQASRLFLLAFGLPMAKGLDVWGPLAKVFKQKIYGDPPAS